MFPDNEQYVIKDIVPRPPVDVGPLVVPAAPAMPPANENGAAGAPEPSSSPRNGSGSVAQVVRPPTIFDSGRSRERRLKNGGYRNRDSIGGAPIPADVPFVDEAAGDGAGAAGASAAGASAAGPVRTKKRSRQGAGGGMAGRKHKAVKALLVRVEPALPAVLPAAGPALPAVEPEPLPAAELAPPAPVVPAPEPTRLIRAAMEALAAAEAALRGAQALPAVAQALLGAEGAVPVAPAPPAAQALLGAEGAVPVAPAPPAAPALLGAEGAVPVAPDPPAAAPALPAAAIEVPAPPVEPSACIDGAGPSACIDGAGPREGGPSAGIIDPTRPRENAPAIVWQKHLLNQAFEQFSRGDARSIRDSANLTWAAMQRERYPGSFRAWIEHIGLLFKQDDQMAAGAGALRELDEEQGQQAEQAEQVVQAEQAEQVVQAEQAEPTTVKKEVGDDPSGDEWQEYEEEEEEQAGPAPIEQLPVVAPVKHEGGAAYESIARPAP